MARNDAQQAAAQVAETRETLAKQGRRNGLAESVRKDAIRDTNRGKGHDKPQMSGSTDNMMRGLFCPPR